MGKVRIDEYGHIIRDEDNQPISQPVSPPLGQSKTGGKFVLISLFALALFAFLYFSGQNYNRNPSSFQSKDQRNEVAVPAKQENYSWNLSWMGNNYSEDDTSTDHNDFVVGDVVYFHAYLYGGPPGESIQLEYEIRVDGVLQSHANFNNLQSNGSYIWVRRDLSMAGNTELSIYYYNSLGNRIHLGSTSIYASSDEWDAKFFAKNTSKDDLSTNRTEFNKGETIYFHGRLQGGPRGGNILLHYRIYINNKLQLDSPFSSRSEDGSTIWVSYDTWKSGDHHIELYYIDEYGYEKWLTGINAYVW